MAPQTATASKTDEQVTGIVFPVTGDGRRSSLTTGREIFAAAVAPVSPEDAAAIRAARNWRNDYPPHVGRLVELSLQQPENALKIAAAGLSALYEQFEFVRGGKALPIAQALSEPDDSALYTAAVAGAGQGVVAELTIPYKNELLSGERLLRQIERWERQGIIEPSAAAALRRVHAHPEWLDLSDHTFVLLGAAAEMGPWPVLRQWRANVVLVDVPQPRLWQRLLEQARAGNGTTFFPLRMPPTAEMSDAELAANAGCDLIREAPEVVAWLLGFDGPLTVGGYAYLDGSRHVQVALAMDAVMNSLLARRDDVSLAFLLTPTDVYGVPEAAARMAQARYAEWQSRGLWSLPQVWQRPLHALSGERFFRPNVEELVTAADGKQYGIVDCLVLQQGPNYALAKRLQQWRALVARSEGVRVSCNVAPATTTLSVVKSAALAAAYAGAHRFGVEIFNPQTSNALMAALLVHDLRYEETAADAAVALDNPLELFMEGATHNGLWRTGFAARSVMEIAAVWGWRAALGRS